MANDAEYQDAITPEDDGSSTCSDDVDDAVLRTTAIAKFASIILLCYSNVTLQVSVAPAKCYRRSVRVHLRMLEKSVEIAEGTKIVLFKDRCLHYISEIVLAIIMCR